MSVRLFDPQRDQPDTLVALWNEAYGTTLFRPEHFARLNPDNVLLVESNEGEVVGFALLLDGGLPYIIIDLVYLRPRWNRFATIRDVLQAAGEICKDRGALWYYGLLHSQAADAEHLLDLLRRRAQWNAQYLGEIPMFCRPVNGHLSS